MIDQVCINQKDIDEQSQQVAQTHDIFSRATKVLVWLGPSFEGSHGAIHHTVLTSFQGKNLYTSDHLASFLHLLSLGY